MEKAEQFRQTISEGYRFQGDSILIGAAMLDGQVVPGTGVKIPVSMMNRHGLVAGATGTGKTKTLQAIAEQLSERGISVVMLDMKGDVSGIAMPGNPDPKIDARMQKIGREWKAKEYPVEFLSISDEKQVRLRATVSEFGPVLFSRILELNDIQEGVVALVFKYCDDNKLPLLDLKDFRKALNYLANEGKKEIASEYGQISTASAGTILRKIVEIEEQGADIFFGEISFDVEDLIRIDEKGQGTINVLRVSDIQQKPKLFSTFMLCLLAEIYHTFPEIGDKADPKLVVMIDEAHLVFNEASKALLQQISTIIKLIRSKGVGIIFCTQLPTDIPAEVLSQLGLKIQHALRAFTANDRKAIELTAENYPVTEFYKTDDLITALGVGEALVTALNEKGIPTPLAHTLMISPQSRMDILTPDEIAEHNRHSQLIIKYNQQVDRESAYEILGKKLEQSTQSQSGTTEKQGQKKQKKEDKTMLEEIAGSRSGQTIIREVTRGIFGMLSKKKW